MALKCATKGNANPQGKPRVYFCAHPNDYVFFDDIKSDVLAIQNCAIYYKDDPSLAIEREDLKEMQLILLPVTNRFLCEESVAKEEFFLAKELNIPVLPLAQDSGLENKFNEICGEMQMLDKNNADATAISYYDKLEKFLSAVLIGDELAEKIRAAFDAYIFLSYRKKDRAYAQELMRLIHKNEFCRDIAIWYDEFLTPGENFNSAIEEALENSGLFALVVTPNLVNEKNYVETVEYPLAKKQGKKVIPAELLPTDREALKEKFDGLDEPTDARNEQALSSVLLETLRSLAIKENDRSPEHNFFIGLAYLSGIDVEVDFEKACSLLEKSAKDGLPEACAKLAEMYKNGMGVKKDSQKAIDWKKKQVEIYSEQYEKSKGTDGERDALVLYAKAMDDLGDDFCVLGRFNDANEAYVHAGVTLNRFLEKTYDKELFLLQAESYFGYAEVKGHQGKVDLQKRFLEGTISSLKKLREKDDSVEVKKKLAKACRAYLEFANFTSREIIDRSKNFPSPTGEQLDDALNTAFVLYREFAKEEGTETARLDYHAICLLAAFRKSYVQNYELAWKLYDRSFIIAENLLEEGNSIPARRAYAKSCGRYAAFLENGDNLEEEIKWRKKAIEAKEKLFEETDSFIDLDSLVADYQRMAFCNQYDVKDDKETEKYYRLTVDAYRKLMQRSDSEHYKYGFARKARWLIKYIPWEEGLALFDEIVAMWEKCLEKKETEEYKKEKERFEFYRDSHIRHKEKPKEPEEKGPTLQESLQYMKEHPDEFDKATLDFMNEFFGGELETDNNNKE